VGFAPLLFKKLGEVANHKRTDFYDLTGITTLLQYGNKEIDYFSELNLNNDLSKCCSFAKGKTNDTLQNRRRWALKKRFQ
jgi:hypothetical protein